jgi:hypothetical protein
MKQVWLPGFAGSPTSERCWDCLVIMYRNVVFGYHTPQAPDVTFSRNGRKLRLNTFGVGRRYHWKNCQSEFPQRVSTIEIKLWLPYPYG